MLVFNRFLARSTSNSETEVARRIHSFCRRINRISFKVEKNHHLDIEDHVLLVELVGDEVDAPEPGVLVAGVEALEAVGDPQLAGGIEQILVSWKNKSNRSERQIPTPTCSTGRGGRSCWRRRPWSGPSCRSGCLRPGGRSGQDRQGLEGASGG